MIIPFLEAIVAYKIFLSISFSKPNRSARSRRFSIYRIVVNRRMSSKEVTMVEATGPVQGEVRKDMEVDCSEGSEETKTETPTKEVGPRFSLSRGDSIDGSIFYGQNSYSGTSQPSRRRRRSHRHRRFRHRRRQYRRHQEGGPTTMTRKRCS